MTEDILAELVRLQAENARLKAMLQQHGISCDVPLPPTPPVSEDAAVGVPATFSPSLLSPADKIALFQSLFRGRTDVYPQRWNRKRARQDILLYAAMNGVLESAASPRYDVTIVNTGN